MTEHIRDLTELSTYLSAQDDDSVETWVCDFILHGYTSPLALAISDQPRSSLLLTLIRNSGRRTKKVMYAAVIKTYRTFEAQGADQGGFIELLDCIARLNVTELFLDLWRRAYGGKLRDIMVLDAPIESDLHNHILRTVFGITILPETRLKRLELARSFITQPRYMLECFNAICGLGNLDEAASYFPNLIGQLASRKRNYAGAVKRFIQSWSSENARRLIPRIAARLSSNQGQLDAFIQALRESDIEVIDVPRGLPMKEPSLRVKTRVLRLDPKKWNEIEPLHRRQINIESAQIARLAIEGMAKEYLEEQISTKLSAA